MPDLATALKNAINKLDTNKEKQVQTIHTATSNTSVQDIINQWDKDPAKDAGQHKVTKPLNVTSNVSRATFDLIKANPGNTYGKICDVAQMQGYNRASAGSIISQLLHVGMVKKDDTGALFVTQHEYTPIKYKELRRKQRKAKREAVKAKKQETVAKPGKRAYVKSGKYTKKAEAGIAALDTQTKTPMLPLLPPAPLAPTTPTVTNFNADQLLSTLSFTQAIALYKKLKAMLGEV